MNNMDQQEARKEEYINEDEAALYDRQIRLWGLEAQNRMRNSTVLVLSLRSLAHETIKNLVLAGIGRLIIMDDGVVTEEDLGAGFLFREADGAVGQNRAEVMKPQIVDLNPRVGVSAFSSLEPFVPGSNGAPSTTNGSDTAAMADFLRNERVDVLVACDLARDRLESINDAARQAGTKFYAAGTYGFYGYAFADLGDSFDFVVNTSGSSLAKKQASFIPLRETMDRTGWSEAQGTEQKSGPQNGSPFRGLSRHQTKVAMPGLFVGILALWDYEIRHGSLPSGASGQQEQLQSIAEELRESLGVNTKALPAVDAGMISHLAQHSSHFFPPTLAIMGGLLAQDVLRALSRKDKPITNLLVLDSMTSNGVVSRWGMNDAVDA